MIIKKVVELKENFLAGQSITHTSFALIPIDDNIYYELKNSDVLNFLFEEFKIIAFKKGLKFSYLEEDGLIELERIIYNPDKIFSVREMEILLEFLLKDGFLDEYFLEIIEEYIEQE